MKFCTFAVNFYAYGVNVEKFGCLQPLKKMLKLHFAAHPRNGLSALPDQFKPCRDQSIREM